MSGDHPLSPAEFDAIYRRVPRLTVEVVLATAGGVALTRRSIEPCRGQWHLPGGTVRFEESLPDAVVRIARNELGVGVSVGPLLGYIEYPQMRRGGYAGWPVGIAFETRVVEGALIAGDQADEVGVFRAVPPDTIVEQAAFLRDYLDRHPGVPPGETVLSGAARTARG
jgi:ADP-ribose pyrophosphatase YjhB (NUDIX family)